MFPRPLPQSRVVWPSLIAALAALDWYCDRGEPDGDTLTELVRSLLRPETTPGRIATAALLGAGAEVLYTHFCKVV